MRNTPDETLRALRDSIDADVLRDDYPHELVEQELREAGRDPDALVARCRPQVDALLAKRKEVPCEASRCSRYWDCQREAGHSGPHRSRSWDAQATSEVVEEWDDDGNRETFR